MIVWISRRQKLMATSKSGQFCGFNLTLQTLDESEWNGLFFLRKNPETPLMFSKL